MPFTLFAHQVPAVGMKIGRPRWFDGTALCIGSMAPDLAYAVSGYTHVDTHDWDGLVLVLPLALVLTLLARWVGYATVPAQLPDLGRFRLHSWRVAWRRQPAWWITGVSVALGVATHIGLDAFTHKGRFGARWLGYDDAVVTVFGRPTYVVSLLQYLGHTLGSLAGAWLLWEIGRRRLLERWYSNAEVDAARAVRVTLAGRVVFWAVVAASGVVGLLWAVGGGRLEWFERPFLSLALGAVLASALPWCRPTPAALCQEPEHTTPGQRPTGFT
ncbi:MAG: DUF4184 family protein [Ilumatobacter sp.]|nr:DUF4184 family protein [Ilumatobacter sp.]